MREHGPFTLGHRGNGQEQVASSLDRGIHERVDADAELELVHQRVVPALRLRGAGAGQEVRVLEAAHLESVGLRVVAGL